MKNTYFSWFFGKGRFKKMIFLKSDEIKELYKNWKMLYYKKILQKHFWKKWPFYSLIAKNLEINFLGFYFKSI